jgi:hypothetical protein
LRQGAGRGRLTQVDQTLDRSHGGLGIGLTLVKTLVELHGGSVWADNCVGGTRCEFTVRLPAMMPEEQSPETPNRQLRTQGMPPKRRVMVVDDVRPSAKTLAIAMPKMDGYQLAKRIQAIPGLRPVLVALTRYGQEEDRQRAFEAGFDHHMVKPTSLEALHQFLLDGVALSQRNCS